MICPMDAATKRISLRVACDIAGTDYQAGISWLHHVGLAPHMIGGHRGVSLLCAFEDVLLLAVWTHTRKKITLSSSQWRAVQSALQGRYPLHGDQTLTIVGDLVHSAASASSALGLLRTNGVCAGIVLRIGAIAAGVEPQWSSAPEWSGRFTVLRPWDTSGETMTTAEAARHTGLSRERIRQWVADGRLPSTRVGKSVIVTRTDLEQIRAAPKRVRGPGKRHVFWDNAGLGTVPDAQIARREGVTVSAVFYQRKLRGILPFRKRQR